MYVYIHSVFVSIGGEGGGGVGEGVRGVLHLLWFGDGYGKD